MTVSSKPTILAGPIAAELQGGLPRGRSPGQMAPCWTDLSHEVPRRIPLFQVDEELPRPTLRRSAGRSCGSARRYDCGRLAAVRFAR